jgi:hypothetical protein
MSSSTEKLKKLQAEQRYLEQLHYWSKFPILNYKLCTVCKKRKILPCGTTSSLPIRPVWSGRDGEDCIVCCFERNKQFY